MRGDSIDEAFSASRRDLLRMLSCDVPACHFAVMILTEVRFALSSVDQRTLMNLAAWVPDDCIEA